MPLPTPAPLPHRLPTPPPRRKFNRTAVYLAVAIAVVMLPFTLRYQRQRADLPKPPSNFATANSQGPLPELYNITESQARKRFGEPVETHDYPLNVGSFAGPYNGLKHYYRFTDPDYEKRVRGAETVWTYPQFLTIREMIWRQEDSYLTVWLTEPRAEVSLGSGDNAEITLPDTAVGDWVALDNYRVGKGLLKAEPKFR